MNIKKPKEQNEYAVSLKNPHNKVDGVHVYIPIYQPEETDKHIKKALKKADKLNLRGQKRVDFIQAIPRSYKWKHIGNWKDDSTHLILDSLNIPKKQYKELEQKYLELVERAHLFNLRSELFKVIYPYEQWSVDNKKEKNRLSLLEEKLEKCGLYSTKVIERILKDEQKIPTRYQKAIESMYISYKKEKINQLNLKGKLSYQETAHLFYQDEKEYFDYKNN